MDDERLEGFATSGRVRAVARGEAQAYKCAPSDLSIAGELVSLGLGVNTPRDTFPPFPYGGGSNLFQAILTESHPDILRHLHRIRQLPNQPYNYTPIITPLNLQPYNHNTIISAS